MTLKKKLTWIIIFINKITQSKRVHDNKINSYRDNNKMKLVSYKEIFTTYTYQMRRGS